MPRRTQELPSRVHYISHTGLSPSVAALSRSVPLCNAFLTLQETVPPPLDNPTTPIWQRSTAYTISVWALPISLAATLGISVDFSSSRYLDGSVPWVSLPHPMCSGMNDRTSLRPGYPIRQPTDLRMYAPPRRFSQLTTAFFARQFLGIRHGPLFA